MSYEEYPPSRQTEDGRWTCRKCRRVISGTGVYPGPCHSKCGPIRIAKPRSLSE